MTTAACANVLLRRFCLHVIFWLKRFDDVGVLILRQTECKGFVLKASLVVSYARCHGTTSRCNNVWREGHNFVGCVYGTSTQPRYTVTARTALVAIENHVVFLWPPCVADADTILFVLWILSSSIYLSFFPRLISAATNWMSTILLHMAWPCANLECRSEMWCSRLAANTGRKKSSKIAIWVLSDKFVGLYLRK